MNVFQEALGDLAKEHPALDITKWSEDWLGTPGTNTIELKWTPGESSATFEQGVANENFSTLRYHKVRVAFFNEKTEVVRTEDYYINNVASTQIDLGDLTGITAILPNYQDHDFVLVILDKISREFLRTNINLITDDLTKGIIEKSFFDMVRNQKITANEFLELVVSVLTPELSNEGLNAIFSFSSEVLGYYALDADRSKYSAQIFDKLLAMSQAVTDKDSDTFNVIVNKMLQTASTDAQIDVIYTIYKAFRLGFSNWNAGIGGQWQAVSLIQSSSTISAEEKKRVFDELLALDETDTKIQYQLIIEAKQARGAERQAIWDSCTAENIEFSYHHLQYKLMGLNSSGVPAEERAKTIAQYATQIVDLINTRSRSIGKSFLYYFVPRGDDLTEFVTVVKAAIAELKEEDRFARKKVTQLVENVELYNKSRALLK